MLKYYANFVDPHWVAVVATGLYTHLRQICIIGLCFEENYLPFDPSYSSVLFVLSVLCLLAEYRLWPITLKEPPIQLLYIYEVSDFYSNFSPNSRSLLSSGFKSGMRGTLVAFRRERCLATVVKYVNLDMVCTLRFSQKIEITPIKFTDFITTAKQLSLLNVTKLIHGSIDSAISTHRKHNYSLDTFILSCRC